MTSARHPAPASADADESLVPSSQRPRRSPHRRAADRANDSDIECRLADVELRSARMENQLGAAPNEVTGEPGSGVFGMLVQVRRTQLEDKSEREEQRKLDAAVAEAALAAALAAEARRKRLATWVGVPSFAVLVAVLVGVVRLAEALGVLAP